jgi:hypothetical protein
MLAPIIGAGASLLGGILGNKGAKKQNAMQIAMAQKQMDFQERMSSSAHQRQVKDLKLAGLNPILSANTGASSPSGAQATIADEMAPALATAQQVAQLNLTMKNLKAQNKLINNQALKAKAETDGIRYDNSYRRVKSSAIDTVEGVLTGNTTGKGVSQGQRKYQDAIANIINLLDSGTRR